MGNCEGATGPCRRIGGMNRRGGDVVHLVDYIPHGVIRRDVCQEITHTPLRDSPRREGADPSRLGMNRPDVHSLTTDFIFQGEGSPLWADLCVRK